ncbi:Carbamoyl-phosphate synthase large chain (Carbamoyl-phosphate synthetase ammonia chain), partial [sediment metagenome]
MEGVFKSQLIPFLVLFNVRIHALKLTQPPNTTARSEADAVTQAASIGYPLVVRPSYVLGGRAME